MVLTMLWWGRTDSNHRSETQQIYSLPPLATRELPHIWSFMSESNQQPADYKSAALPLSQWSLFGGNNRDRTCDPLLVRQMLSQLSYASIIFKMVTPRGIEPLLPPWKGGVLTAWPRGHNKFLNKTKLQ